MRFLRSRNECGTIETAAIAVLLSRNDRAEGLRLLLLRRLGHALVFGPPN